MESGIFGPRTPSGLHLQDRRLGHREMMNAECEKIVQRPRSEVRGHKESRVTRSLGSSVGGHAKEETAKRRAGERAKGGSGDGASG